MRESTAPSTDDASARLQGLADLQDALRLAEHVVSDDPAQLAGQLIGRLAVVRSRGVARVLADAGNRRGAPWFRPLTPSLVPVGGPMRMTLSGHTGWVGATALSADGGTAVSGGDDATVRVWDLKSGSCRFVLSGHDGPVRGVAVSADGTIGVSGGDDGTVRAWDVGEGRELSRLERHAGPVRSVALSGDGRTAVSGGDDGRVCAWSLHSGQLTELPGHEGKVRGVAISADGRVAVSGGDDGNVAVWDLDRAEKEASAHAHRVWCVAVDGVGSTVVWGVHDHHLMVWEPGGGREPVKRAGHGGAVRAVAVTPDGTTTVSCSDDRTVRVWGRSAAAARVLGEHGAAVGAVAVDAFGRVAVSGSGDGTLIVWDLERHDEPAMSVPPMQHALDWSVAGLAVARDGSVAVSRGGDGSIKTWDLSRWSETGARRDERHDLDHAEGGLALLPAGAVDVAYDPARRGRVLRVWDVESGALLERLDASDVPVRVNVLASMPDARHVLAGRLDGQLTIFDLVDRTHTTADFRHRSSVNDVAVSRDGRFVVTASSDGTVGVWDGSGWSQLSHTIGDGAPAVTAVTVMPDSRRVAAGYADGAVALWDLDEAVDLARTRQHRDVVTSLVALPDGQTVVSTSFDRTVRAWWPMLPERTGPAFTGQTPMLCAAVSPDGVVVLAGEDSGRIHALRLVDSEADQVAVTPPAP